MPVALILKAVFGFLKKYWLQIIIVVAVASALLYVRHLYTTVKEQEKQIAEMTVQLKECAASNQAFDKMLSAQNDAIKKWGDASEKQLKEFEKLPGLIAKQGGKTSADIKAIFGGYKPQTCEDAIQYLISAAKEYKR